MILYKSFNTLPQADGKKNILQTNLAHQMMLLSLTLSFCQYICQLILCVHMLCLYSLSFTFSLIEWQSISMCFVRSWKIGFAVIWIATLLSHNIWTGSFTANLSSLNRPFNHTISAAVEAILLNSTSAELLPTLSYFFEFQDIKASPK